MSAAALDSPPADPERPLRFPVFPDRRPPRLREPESDDLAPTVLLEVREAEEVSRRLEEAGLRHWIQRPYPNLFGGPPMTTILLKHGIDCAAVQDVLETFAAENDG